MEIEEYQKKIDDSQKEIIAIKVKINKLKELANEKKLPGKVAKVIMFFGTMDYDANMDYIERDFTLYKRRCFVRVRIAGKDVFRANVYENDVGNIDLYLPGAWENRIEQLLKQIPEIKREREINALKYEIAKLKEMWCLK